MRHRSMICTTTLLIAMAGCGSRDSSPDPTAQEQPLADRASRETAAFTRARAEHKGVMVELFAKWSTPCVALDRALRDPSVAPVLADHFVTLRFDVSDSTDEDAALRERYAVQGEPMLVFVAPDGSVVGRVATYLDPPQLASDITAAAARLAR